MPLVAGFIILIYFKTGWYPRLALAATSTIFNHVLVHDWVRSRYAAGPLSFLMLLYDIKINYSIAPSLFIICLFLYFFHCDKPSLLSACWFFFSAFSLIANLLLLIALVIEYWPPQQILFHSLTHQCSICQEAFNLLNEVNEWFLSRSYSSMKCSATKLRWILVQSLEKCGDWVSNPWAW